MNARTDDAIIDVIDALADNHNTPAEAAATLGWVFGNQLRNVRTADVDECIRAFDAAKAAALRG